MAANIDMTNGKANMAYAGTKTPWHGLGSRIDESEKYNVAACSTVAGLDFEVGLKALQTVDGIPIRERAVYRLDNNAILNVVGPHWTPLQNNKIFSWFQPWLDSKMCAIETCGSLGHGEKVWCLAKTSIDPVDIVKGSDPVESYILLSNVHGIGAVRAGFTPIRVVCQNTLSMAHDSASSKLVRVRHSSKVESNLSTIHEVMDLARQEFLATAEQYRMLANKGVNGKDLIAYVKVVMGMTEEKDSPQSRTKLADIINLAVNGIGQDNARGTWWGAYNGITEYLSYRQGRTQSNRLDSLWFGAGANINQRAFTEAIRMAS
jgi:phage/plasmid-like protein (TIGR03299 family)